MTSIAPTTHIHRPRILVGVSSTPSGSAALDVAIRTAVATDGRLHLVRVWREIGRFFATSLTEARQLTESQQQDQRILRQAENSVRAAAPGIPCTAELVRGDLYGNLQTRAAEADLLLLGSGDRRRCSDAIGHWFEQHVGIPVYLVEPDGSARRSDRSLLISPERDERAHHGLVRHG